MTDEILKHTERVAMELSNICNLGYCHKECPASLVKPEGRVALPARHVYHVLDTLGRLGFEGQVTYYGYSEPAIDPRLGHFIEYTRRACPGATPSITTNGFNITQQMVDDLYDLGLRHARVSAYGQHEMERLSKIKAKFPFDVRLRGGGAWNHRIDDYERKPDGNKKPCFAPLIDIQVNCHGKVRVCCADYKNMHTFGDLNEEGLEDIIRSGRMQAVYAELRKGVRTLHLCQRCGIRREPIGVCGNG